MQQKPLRNAQPQQLGYLFSLSFTCEEDSIGLDVIKSFHTHGLMGIMNFRRGQQPKLNDDWAIVAASSLAVSSELCSSTLNMSFYFFSSKKMV